MRSPKAKAVVIKGEKKFELKDQTNVRHHLRQERKKKRKFRKNSFTGRKMRWSLTTANKFT